jgi:hypothetical protein
MANREQRSNREKRKPKAEKNKPPVSSASPFSSVVAREKAGHGGQGKKGR